MDLNWLYGLTANGASVMAGLNPSERLVALILSCFRNHEDGKCCPSQTTIAGVAGLSRETVNRCLIRLESKGIITSNAQAKSCVKGYKAGSVLEVALGKIGNCPNEKKTTPARTQKKQARAHYREIGYANIL